MGSTWPFLLMYESHDMRHTGFPQVDCGQRDLRKFGASHPSLRRLRSPKGEFNFREGGWS